ncbi:MAG: GSCFA domain-containing protein [Bacteroidales bacterium]|jgi:hypothetical protein|nr:GSCFA domain-containing protein [Bacteroidales bacterium]
MNFFTEINIEKPLFNIGHKDNITLIGSCFTQNIGLLLKRGGFNVEINPFGIIYNPITIAQEINFLTNNRNFYEEDLVFSDNKWKIYACHGEIYAKEKQEALKIINTKIANSNKFIHKTKYLILTLGTSNVYSLISNNKIVGNCHKIPAKNFEKRLLSTNEIVDILGKEVENFLSKTKNNSTKIIITISPIRHIKDGYRENQISKSILHIASEKIRQLFPDDVFYFPAYEIMMDELRDYRFYEEDMLHPNKIAIKLIWEKFQKTFFDEKTTTLCVEFEKLNKMIEHRPFDSESPSYKEHLKKIEVLKERLTNKINNL